MKVTLFLYFQPKSVDLWPCFDTTNQSCISATTRCIFLAPGKRTDVVYPLHTCVILQCMWISYQIHKEYIWRSKTFWMPLFSKNKRISNSIQRHFFLLYNFREKLYYANEVFKKKVEKIVIFCDRLRSCLKLCPILSAFSQWCSKVHTTHATVSKLDYKNIVEDGSSWCTYWFPCQGKH